MKAPRLSGPLSLFVTWKLWERKNDSENEVPVNSLENLDQEMVRKGLGYSGSYMYEKRP